MTQIPLVQDLLVDERTGEMFTPVGREDWSGALARWSADLRRIEAHPLLARLRARQQRQRGTLGRESWHLYGVAKRALKLRGLPSPMPEGHCMFENPAAYGLVRVGGAT